MRANLISVLYSRTALIAARQKSCRPMPWHRLKAQLHLKFLLVTQHEVAFINTSEATKRLSNLPENGKCINVMTRQSCDPILQKPLQQ